MVNNLGYFDSLFALKLTLMLNFQMRIVINKFISIFFKLIILIILQAKEIYVSHVKELWTEKASEVRIGIVLISEGKSRILCWRGNRCIIITHLNER